MQCIFQLEGPLSDNLWDAGGGANDDWGTKMGLTRTVARLKSVWNQARGRHVDVLNHDFARLPQRLAATEAHMQVGVQHDAADFLNMLLEGADSILETKSGPSMAELIGGQMRQVRHCKSCGVGQQVGCNPDFVMRLQTRVNSVWSQDKIPEEGAHKSTRLIDLIHEQRWSVPLPDLRCRACGVVTEDANAQVHETFQWNLTSDTFVTCLQRFKADSFDGRHAVWSKDSREIACPYTLQIGDSLYSLVGVVGHTGASIHAGHYTAMVRNGEDGLWYSCNDGSVTECNGAAPGNMSFTQLADGADPCILFYQKHVLLDKSKTNRKASDLHNTCKPDSPETQVMNKYMNITPKRQQSFQPNACKTCGCGGCIGECVQRL